MWSLRRAFALAVLALTAVAVAATSQRRWRVLHPAVTGSVTIPAGMVSAEHRVQLGLTPPGGFAGQRVDFVVTLRAEGITPAGARAQALVRAGAEPWTQPDGRVDAPVTGLFGDVCPTGRPCEATFTVRWTRDPTAVGEALTLRWRIEPRAEGFGADPTGGALTVRELP
jgi:hypothetical protein